MWSAFALACVAGALFLYVPGYLFLRAGRIGRIAALCLAPLVSVFAYEVLGIVYNLIGVFSSWVNVFGAALAVAVIACGVSFGAFKSKRMCSFGFNDAASKRLTSKNISFDWLCLGAYVVIALVVGITFCLMFYNTPDAYPEAYDLVHHAGGINAYVLSGDWSTLHSWLYYGDNAQTAPISSDGFYPSAYYTLCAMAVSVSGISATAAMNAVNMLCICLVFPMGMYAFMGRIFADKPWARAVGSLLTVVFGAFPWAIFTWGPLFPNLAALAFMPAFAFCFLLVAEAGIDRASRISALVVGLVGLVSLAFLQPNAVFSAYVLLVPYYVCRVGKAVAARVRTRDEQALVLARVLGFGAGAAFAVACAAFWVVLFCLPPLQGVVTYTWEAFATPSQAFFDILTLKLRGIGWQPVLAVLVLIGVLYTLRERKYFWLTCAYVFAGIIYTADIASSGLIQHLLSGFWYTDSPRIAAMVDIFAMPLAALGAWAVGHAFFKLTTLPEKRGLFALAKGCRAAGTVVFAAALVFGAWWFFEDGCKHTGEEGNALAYYVTNTKNCFKATSHRFYDETERAFLEQVKEVVGAGALIINEPNDGSAFAAATDPALNVYYRYMRGYEEPYETAESVLIRKQLADVATDENVAQAVRTIGAEYVLALDYRRMERDDRMWSYDGGGMWAGIDAVQDDTPGFEVVLSQGDMRLFRIVAVADGD